MGKPRVRQGGAPLEPENEVVEQQRRDVADPPPEGLMQQVNQILRALTDTKEALQQDIAQVSLGLRLLWADHVKLVDRVKSTEVALEVLEPAQKAIDVKMGEVTRRLRVLERRAEDAEGRNRRNNIRVVGLPEGIAGTSIIDYLEQWLRTVVAPEGLTPFYTLERAHRVPARPLAPGRPPRPVAARLLHYKDRDLLLHKPPTAGPYRVDNINVSLFPDYTLDVQRHRASFLAVKKALRDEGIQYSLMFPARLQVTLDGKTFFHNDPDEAWSWLETYRAGTDGKGGTREQTAETSRPYRTRRTRRRRPGTQGPSTMQTETEKEKERSAALQAVTEISQASGATLLGVTDSEKGTAETDSDGTDAGSVTLPHVTPRTADEIVDA